MSAGAGAKKRNQKTRSPVSKFVVPNPQPVRSPIEHPQVRQSIQAAADANAAAYYRLKLTQPYRQQLALSVPAIAETIFQEWISLNLQPATPWDPMSIGIAVYQSTVSELLIADQSQSLGDPDVVTISAKQYSYTRLPISYPDGVQIGSPITGTAGTVALDLFLFPTID